PLAKRCAALPAAPVTTSVPALPRTRAGTARSHLLVEEVHGKGAVGSHVAARRSGRFFHWNPADNFARVAIEHVDHRVPVVEIDLEAERAADAAAEPRERLRMRPELAAHIRRQALASVGPDVAGGRRPRTAAGGMRERPDAGYRVDVVC